MSYLIGVARAELDRQRRHPARDPRRLNERRDVVGTHPLLDRRLRPRQIEPLRMAVPDGVEPCHLRTSPRQKKTIER